MALIPVESKGQTTETAKDLHLDRAREAARVTYMIKPDRRFVRAAEFIVQKLAKEKTSDTITLAPRGDKWAASISGKSLGEVGQLEGFAGNFKFVEAVAKQHVDDRKGASPDSSKKLEKLESEASEAIGEQLLDVGRKIDAAWQDESMPLPLHAATKTSLFFLMQTIDKVGLGDEIAARAIAFMATECALRNDPMIRHKAMLAKFLGYDAEAWQFAQELPQDPIKMFVYNKGAELFEVANRADATLATWYLSARLAATNSNQESLLSLFKKRANITPETHMLALAPLLPHLSTWDGSAQLAMQTAGSIAVAVSGRDPESKSAFSKDDKLIELFVEGLESLEIEGTGPLVDRQLGTSIYETAFSNAIEQAMTFFINQLGSMDDARTMGQMLGVVDNGPVGEYSRLMAARLSETGEGDSSKRLQSFLESLQYVNADMAYRVYNKIDDNFETLMPQTVNAGVTWMNLLDGRPSNYVHLKDIFTVRSFRDLSAAEKVFAAKASPPCAYNVSEQAYLHFFRGENELLMKKLEDSHISDSTRAMYVVTFLDKDPNFTTPTLDKKMEDLYARNPTNRSIANNYIEYLKNHDRLDDAIVVATKFAESQATKQDLSYPHARTSLATLHAENKDFKKALEVTESVAESYTGAALRNMSEYNTALGNYKEGMDWAQKSVERYENSPSSLGVLTYNYWAQGMYAEAAAAIKEYKYPLSTSLLRFSLADYFLLALGDKSPEERERALVELTKVGLNSELGNMGYRYRSKKRFDMLFEFLRHVKETGYQRFRADMISYNALRMDKGTSAAVQWLSQAVSEADYPALGPLAFRESEYDLLHALVPHDDSTTLGKYNWTLRAAAVCADKHAADLMGERVRGHFQADNSGEFHSVAGRYLLGLDDQNALQAAVKNSGDLCHAACYLGLKARADGDYRTASDWLQVAILTGEEHLDEYHKARLILAGWAVVNRSLDIMEQQLAASPEKIAPGM
jgi:hypothetical protein